jgi:hypothetical protein
MSQDIAYLSRGKLHVVSATGAVRTIDSKFGKDVRDRAIQLQQRNAWKMQGSGARFMSGGALWGAGDRDPAAMRIAIAGISRGCEPGDVLYALETSEVAGLFTVRHETGEERRLFHSADTRVRHVSASRGNDFVACALAGDAGISNIAIMRADGTEFLDVTEGDSVDLAPSWVPGEPRALVFQTAGVARDADGFARGHGPFSINKIDLDTGEMTGLAEDPKSDLLGPRVAQDGALYYIRRPYRPPNERVNPLRLLLDFLLFPFRLIYAIFSYLNFFTVRYTGKPLTTAGNAKQKEMDIRQMMVWGNMIDAQKAAREGSKAGDDAPALVPSSWQLVRDARGAQEVVAKGVLSFDLADDGSIVYSNGSAVYRIAPDGKSDRVHIDGMIEQVIAV